MGSRKYIRMIEPAGDEKITDRVMEEIRKGYCTKGRHAYWEMVAITFVETKAGTILWWCTNHCPQPIKITDNTL